MIFTMKRGDTEPAITVFLLENGAPIPMTGTTVTFRMRAAGAPARKVDALATINGDGSVTYEWMPADTDTAGKFKAEWVIAYGNGHERTVPNDGFDYIDIIGDL